MSPKTNPFKNIFKSFHRGCRTAVLRNSCLQNNYFCRTPLTVCYYIYINFCCIFSIKIHNETFQVLVIVQVGIINCCTVALMNDSTVNDCIKYVAWVVLVIKRIMMSLTDTMFLLYNFRLSITDELKT